MTHESSDWNGTQGVGSERDEETMYQAWKEHMPQAFKQRPVLDPAMVQLAIGNGLSSETDFLGKL